MPATKVDLIWMERALDEAKNAGAIGEVPVGAVITDGVSLIAAAGNSPIESIDPTAPVPRCPPDCAKVRH